MASQYTSGVLLYLHQKFGPIYQTEMYRSGILFRNKRFFASSVNINVGQAFRMVEDANATNLVDLFENGFYACAWKLYLFL